jgi:hypothetical protein
MFRFGKRKKNPTLKVEVEILSETVFPTFAVINFDLGGNRVSRDIPFANKSNLIDYLNWVKEQASLDVVQTMTIDTESVDRAVKKVQDSKLPEDPFSFASLFSGIGSASANEEREPQPISVRQCESDRNETWKHAYLYSTYGDKLRNTQFSSLASGRGLLDKLAAAGLISKEEDEQLRVQLEKLDLPESEQGEGEFARQQQRFTELCSEDQREDFAESIRSSEEDSSPFIGGFMMVITTSEGDIF